MGNHIKIRKVSGNYVVRAGGAVIGEAEDVLELSEGDHEPVIYINRDDISMEFFDASATKTNCPHKGDASYYSIVTKSRTIKDAAWSYENPLAEVAEIKGYLAFHPDLATVEEL